MRDVKAGRHNLVRNYRSRSDMLDPAVMCILSPMDLGGFFIDGKIL